jgi:hypothetical protein
MKLKTLAAAVAVLAALSALAFWLNRPAPPPSADPRVGQPLVDASVIDGSTGLRFSDQGKTIELARASDGSWRDRSYFDLPADFQKLSSFVGDLASSKVQRFVTASPERIARLDFKDTKVEVLGSGGAPLWSVTLGKNAESGGRFVRFGDLSRAYLSTFNAWLDTDPKSWADATLVSLKPDDIGRIEITFDKGAPLKLERARKGGAWTADPLPAGKVVKDDAVATLLSSMGSLRFSDTSDRSDPGAAAARRHVRTIILTPFSGPAVTISLGRKPEEKRLKPAAAPKPEPAASKSGPGGKAPETAGPGKPGEAKPAPPEFETIPAGPVYAFVTSSDPKAPVNALMGKRACQVDEYVFTGLPEKPDDLFEAAPPPAKTKP